jgi:hypothetical protein
MKTIKIQLTKTELEELFFYLEESVISMLDDEDDILVKIYHKIKKNLNK